MEFRTRSAICFCSEGLFVPVEDGSNSGNILTKMGYNFTSNWSRTLIEFQLTRNEVNHVDEIFHIPIPPGSFFLAK